MHITINGRPLCEHTACMAGRDDQRKVADSVGVSPGNFVCGWDDPIQAARAAVTWAKVHPRHALAVVFTECPLFMAPGKRESV